MYLRYIVFVWFTDGILVCDTVISGHLLIHSVIAVSALQLAFAAATGNFCTEIYTYLIANIIVRKQ